MNVILICLDTYRADAIAATGRNDFIKTPNLDRLIREGVLFENAFGEGQPTIQYRQALCTGMRTFPFSRDYDTIGMWPVLAGWHKIPPEQPTLAEVLLENGFVTGFVSDTYHMFKPTQNYTRGTASWDFIRGQEEDNYRTGPLSGINPSRYLNPQSAPTAKQIQYILNTQDIKDDMDFLPAKVFSSAINFIEDNKENTPFFLWIDSFDPHEPWDPPRRYADMYYPEWKEDWDPIVGISKKPGEEEIRRHIALYHGECTFVDEQIGRLLEALEKKNLLEDTLILVTSDHGTELMDHGTFNKNAGKNRYRHNAEIVCVMRFPKKEHEGKQVKGFVMNQDFFPTILGLLGIEHQPVDGRDMMPLVRGEKESIYDRIITGWSGYKSPIRAMVRTHEYSYSCDYMLDDLDEHLFDLDADPTEMRNIASEKSDLVAGFRKNLEDFLGEKLPGKARHKVWQYPVPVQVLWEKANWEKRFK